MVKITNPMGDVKIGKQGEVVYQRKYGEQIRRQVSPKRAIASQSQIAHRQLYRDALDWRKQLSRPNRRYLEGYCIANWIVDDYKIPLAWSRFALKLYLEKVKFVVMEKAIPEGAGVEEKKQSYDETPGWNPNFFADTWLAETFLTTEGYPIAMVKVRLRRTGNPGLMTVGIRDTAGGRPTGPDLTVGTTDGITLPESPDWELRAVTLPLHNLLPAHLYAIVPRAPDGYFMNYATWAGRNSAPLYADGKHCYSNDGGVSWADYGDAVDNMFETWAVVPGTPGVPGLLHVRHPALLAVVHKRGEATVANYEDLSSLDEEYLTGQVGLDVEQGDTIEATTLPGINYRYQVG